MFNIQHSSNDSIIRLVLTGTITVDETEKLARELSEITSDLDSKTFLLTDARNAVYAFDVNELEDISKRTSKFISKGKTLKEAILINSPRETAISMVFNQCKCNGQHMTNIFSTKEAALSWLNNGY